MQGFSTGVKDDKQRYENGYKMALLNKECLFIHLDHNALQRNLRSTDSDNEEFCDSMEHLAMEEVGIIPLKCTTLCSLN